MADIRLKDILKSNGQRMEQSACLIRFPSDEGVKRNGGRPGASKAPDLILKRLLSLTPHPKYAQHHIKLLSSVTIPDPVRCSGSLEKDQEELGTLVQKTMKDNVIPVIIGGGHETSFGHYLGYSTSSTPVTILNIDAHTDVRPLKNGLTHSGSPFRQALEHPSGCCQSYNVFGLNPSSVSEDHYKFVDQHGKALFAEDLNLQSLKTFLDKSQGQNIMATMDMDAVQQADAPGVSAPNSSGISASLWLKCAYEIGKCSNVRSFDLCEVNPDFDRDQQTVKLAALSIWYFLLGLSFRDV